MHGVRLAAESPEQELAQDVIPVSAGMQRQQHDLFSKGGSLECQISPDLLWASCQNILASLNSFIDNCDAVLCNFMH